MGRRDTILLVKILEDATDIEKFIKGQSFEDFTSSKMMRNAVGMSLINLGEHVKNLTSDTRLANPEIPWKIIAGLRDTTAHNYDKWDFDIIWKTINVDVPILAGRIKEILAK